MKPEVIIIEIRGGLVARLSSTSDDLKIVVVDHDISPDRIITSATIPDDDKESEFHGDILDPDAVIGHDETYDFMNKIRKANSQFWADANNYLG